MKSKSAQISERDDSRSDNMNIDFRYPILIDLSLSIGETSDGDEEGELYYRIELDLREAKDPGLFSIIMCDFEAGRHINDEAVYKLSASYAVGIKHHRELELQNIRYVYEHLARSTAWSKFVDMFSLVCSQSGTDMPRLPPWPEVKWSTESNEETLEG